AFKIAVVTDHFNQPDDRPFRQVMNDRDPGSSQGGSTDCGLRPVRPQITQLLSHDRRVLISGVLSREPEHIDLISRFQRIKQRGCGVLHAGNDLFSTLPYRSIPARICSVIWTATSRALLPSSALTLGSPRSRTQATNEASS